MRKPPCSSPPRAGAHVGLCAVVMVAAPAGRCGCERLATADKGFGMLQVHQAPWGEQHALHQECVLMLTSCKQLRDMQVFANHCCNASPVTPSPQEATQHRHGAAALRSAVLHGALSTGVGQHAFLEALSEQGRHMVAFRATTRPSSPCCHLIASPAQPDGHRNTPNCLSS